MDSKKLYRIFARGGDVAVVTADIISETDKTITIKNCPEPSAFRWRTRLIKDSDLICRTPREAIDAFIKQQQLVIDRARNDMGNARRYVEQAQALYSSAGSGDANDAKAANVST